MDKTKKHVAILGSTGSIGTQALDVIEANKDLFEVEVLTANSNSELLIQQALKHKPNAVVIANENKYNEVKDALGSSDIKVYAGVESLSQVVEMDTIDVVLTALVGYSGLKPTINAIKAKKSIALANKETLVVAGSLITALAKENGVNIYPVDSEHSAIFQCLVGEFHNPIEKIYLTASGGPFRGWKKDKLISVSKQQALKHPNWDMGRKISVDSATMMNKGLELIEACWLFDVATEKIELVIHPQSIVHSMVEFVDGSVVAQLGQPDMRTPIAHVLAFPERVGAGVAALDFSKPSALEFRAPELSRFPVLSMARMVASGPRSLAITFNAANEVAVEAFLAERLSFLNISVVIKAALDAAETQELHSLDDVLACDATARTLTQRILSSL